MMEADDVVAGSNQKLLNEDSDFENDLKKGNNIPLVKRKKMEDLFSYGDKDAEDLGPHDSVASLDTIDAFVGPVKTEFDNLKKLIESSDRELEILEADFYKQVSSKSMELEGIGPDQEAEIDRHRHLFEMQKLMELNQRMSRIE